MTAPAMNMSCLSLAALIVFSFLIVAVALYLISRHPAMKKRYLSQIAHFHERPELSQNRTADFPILSPCEASLLTADAATVVVLMVLALVEKKLLKAVHMPELHFEVTGSDFEGCDSLEKAFLSLIEKRDGAAGTALHQFLKEVSLSLSLKVWTEDKILLRKILEDRALLLQEIVKERGSVSRSEELQWALIPEAGRKDLLAAMAGAGPEQGEEKAILKLPADISLSSLFSGVLQHMSYVQAFLGLKSSEILTICRYFRDRQKTDTYVGNAETAVVTTLQPRDQLPDHILDQPGDHMITGEEITVAAERAGASLRRNYRAFDSMLSDDVMTLYTRITGEIMKQLDDRFPELSEDDQNTFERELAQRKKEGRELERLLKSGILQNEKYLADEEERVDFNDDIRTINPELEKREIELRLKRDMEARELFAARVEREALSSLWSRIRSFHRVKELRKLIELKEEAHREIQRSLWEVRALWEQERRAHLSQRIDDRTQWALAITERAALLTESSFLRSAPESFFREWALSELLVREWKASRFLDQNLLKEYTTLREKRDSYLSVTCTFSLMNEWLQSIRDNLSSPREQSSSLQSQFQEQYATLLRVLDTMEQSTMSTFEEYVSCFSLCDAERRKSLQCCPETDIADRQPDEC
ncbi:MAG: hypothetical protein AB9903_10560 [Vulcanimicrobiota bacterium]